MMRNMTIIQSLIMEFVLDNVSGPTSKWRGIYIVSAKIGINTWLYLETKKALKIHYLDVNSNYSNGFAERNREKMFVHMSNSVTAHPRPSWDLHLILCATSLH
jgi:hypothetical protein